MMNSHPFPRAEGVRSIVLDLVLTIFTCGIFGLYWQYKQIEALNAWLGREEYSFLLWLVLSIVTCSIFAIYYEYKMARGINEIQERLGERVQSDLPLICVLVSLFGFWIASMAIQQHEINKLYGDSSDL
jgi:hypothetical protein